MPPKAHVLYRFSSQAVTLWGIGETIRRRGLERGGYIVEREQVLEEEIRTLVPSLPFSLFSGHHEVRSLFLSPSFTPTLVFCLSQK